VFTGDPAHLQRLAGPQAKKGGHLHGGFGVDAAQFGPVEDPGQGHLQRLRAQPGHRFDVELARADPAHVAAIARATGYQRLVDQRIGHQLGQ
jgi:hypothetical protein